VTLEKSGRYSILEDENDLLVQNNNTTREITQGQDVTTSVPTSGSNNNTSENDTEDSSPNKGPSIRIQKIHPHDNIIGSPTVGVMTRSRKLIANACFISKVEPKNTG
jgi:hypothetical protein